MAKTNPQVDIYIDKAKKWQHEMEKLRSIALSCGLEEKLKWSKPCYTYEDGIVVLITGLRDSCTLSFFKGALLSDPEGILKKPGENTQAGRRMKFTSYQELIDMQDIIKAYILEAIELEKSGAKVELKREEKPVPQELQDAFDADEALKTAFESLTSGRQRAYIMYFTSAKQSETRASRIKEYTKRILCGKGMNDCVCGHSKKMPNCDGSHKNFGGKSM